MVMAQATRAFFTFRSYTVAGDDAAVRFDEAGSPYFFVRLPPAASESDGATIMAEAECTFAHGHKELIYLYSRVPPRDSNDSLTQPKTLRRELIVPFSSLTSLCLVDCWDTNSVNLHPGRFAVRQPADAKDGIFPVNVQGHGLGTAKHFVVVRAPQFSLPGQMVEFSLGSLAGRPSGSDQSAQASSLTGNPQPLPDAVVMTETGPSKSAAAALDPDHGRLPGSIILAPPSLLVTGMHQSWPGPGLPVIPGQLNLVPGPLV